MIEVLFSVGLGIAFAALLFFYFLQIIVTAIKSAWARFKNRNKPTERVRPFLAIRRPR